METNMFYLFLVLGLAILPFVSPGCVPGEFKSHPNLCEKYLVCSNGLFIEMPCAPGTVFNPKINVCDWPYNVDCTSQYNTEKTTKSTSSTSPETTSTSATSFSTSAITWPTASTIPSSSSSPTPSSSSSPTPSSSSSPTPSSSSSPTPSSSSSPTPSSSSSPAPSSSTSLTPSSSTSLTPSSSTSLTPSSSTYPGPSLSTSPIKNQDVETSPIPSSSTSGIVPSDNSLGNSAVISVDISSVESSNDVSSNSSLIASGKSSGNINSNSHCKDNLAPLIHLLRTSNNCHFYTTSATEAEYALAHYGFIQKGSIGLVATTCQCDKNFKPIFRMYRPAISANQIEDQWHTSSQADVQNATRYLGYVYEGIRFYCPGNSGECKATTPLHSYLKKGIHYLSTIIDTSADAIYEGILCYIW